MVIKVPTLGLSFNVLDSTLKKHLSFILKLKIEFSHSVKPLFTFYCLLRNNFAYLLLGDPCHMRLSCFRGKIGHFNKCEATCLCIVQKYQTTARENTVSLKLFLDRFGLGRCN